MFIDVRRCPSFVSVSQSAPRPTPPRSSRPERRKQRSFASHHTARQRCSSVHAMGRGLVDVSRRSAATRLRNHPRQRRSPRPRHRRRADDRGARAVGVVVVGGDLPRVFGAISTSAQGRRRRGQRPCSAETQRQSGLPSGSSVAGGQLRRGGELHHDPNPSRRRRIQNHGRASSETPTPPTRVSGSGSITTPLSPETTIAPSRRASPPDATPRQRSSAPGPSVIVT